MNEKIIEFFIVIILIIALISIYKFVSDTNEKVSELQVEFTGLVNKLENKLNQFSNNMKSATSDNIEQLRKVLILNNQLKKEDKSNLLLVSDTAEDNKYYMSSESTSEEQPVQIIKNKGDNVHQLSEEDTKNMIQNIIDEDNVSSNKDETTDIETEKETKENEDKPEINKEPDKQNDEKKEIENIENIENKEEKFKLDDMEHYKLNDLKDLAKEFKIPTFVRENGKPRQLNKTELYDKIKNFLLK